MIRDSSGTFLPRPLLPATGDFMTPGADREELRIVEAYKKWDSLKGRNKGRRNLRYALKLKRSGKKRGSCPWYSLCGVTAHSASQQPRL
jgi:hypothetical protein